MQTTMTADRAAASVLGAVVLGFIGAAAMAGVTLAAGHGVLMALLIYIVSGTVVMATATAGRLAIAAVATRASRVLARTGPRPAAGHLA